MNFADTNSLFTAVAAAALCLALMLMGSSVSLTSERWLHRLAEEILVRLPGSLGRQARRRRACRAKLLRCVKRLTETCSSFHNGWFIRVMNNDAEEVDFEDESVRRDWAAFSAELSADLAEMALAFEQAALERPDEDLSVFIEWADQTCTKVCRSDALVCRRFGLM